VTAHKAMRRKLLAAHHKAREIRMIVKGLASKRHPLLAHIIPTRRCNLACTYCNEFDDVSNPVPTNEMFQRIDRLGEMGTGGITISGGEPLLPPDLDGIIARIRKNGISAGLLTHGSFLVADRIERLNRAGLEYLQISIDNVMPDDVSKKSLKVLDQKLALLAEHAEFHVNINSVLGSGVRNPEDALAVAHRAIALGFTSTVGILHDHNGQLEPLGTREQEICEDGLVHYCSQQRGYPGIPLMQYTDEQRHREFFTKKACAPRCTVSCVHQVAAIDAWRSPQTFDSGSSANSAAQQLVQLTTSSTRD